MSKEFTVGKVQSTMSIIVGPKVYSSSTYCITLEDSLVFQNSW